MMNNFFDTPDFSRFGIIDNSIGPVPEAFLIKEIADQHTYKNMLDNPLNFNCTTSFIENEYDEEYWAENIEYRNNEEEYDEDEDYEEDYEDEE